MDEERMMVFGADKGPGPDLAGALQSCCCAFIDYCNGEDEMSYDQRQKLQLMEHWHYAVIMANNSNIGPITDAGLFNILLTAECVREVDPSLNSVLLIACTEYHYARERGEL